MESLTEAGAKNARNVGKTDETVKLRSYDIKHDIHTQLIQDAKTTKWVTGIAKEQKKKLHRDVV